MSAASAKSSAPRASDLDLSDSLPSSQPSTGHEQQGRLHLHAVRIFPRRRKFETRNRRMPSIITVQDVQALMTLSQREAAQELDISLTALKNACKKLGMGGWPYVEKKYHSATPNAKNEGSTEEDEREEKGEQEEQEDLMKNFRTWRTPDLLDEIIHMMDTASK